MILLAALLLCQDSNAARSVDAPPAPPRDVTAKTIADAKALELLEQPGRVLFQDGFDSEESFAQWFEVRGRDDGHVLIERDAALVRTGKGSLRCRAPARDGKSSGSGASAWLGADGYDCVHFRRWIRFADDYDQGNLNHTGGGLAGVSGSGKWDEMGKAGIRPDGTDNFSAGFEPWRDWGRNRLPGVMASYVYWMDMERDRDGHWWGNLQMPAAERRVVPERGRWTCLEQRIRVNTVGQADGELATWIDGRLYQHVTGFRWRVDEKLRLKRFDVGIFVHQAVRENVVWYDDVVVSTGYVGPGPAPDEIPPK
jgi:hypothetical protein